MLGYSSFAELSLSKKMASNMKEVEDLLEMINKKARKHALKDQDDLKAFVKKHTGNDKLELWDISFWTTKMKEVELDFKEEELKQYFPLDSVLEGLFRIANKLFSVEIKEVDI